MLRTHALTTTGILVLNALLASSVVYAQNAVAVREISNPPAAQREMTQANVRLLIGMVAVSGLDPQRTQRTLAWLPRAK